MGCPVLPRFSLSLLLCAAAGVGRLGAQAEPVQIVPQAPVRSLRWWDGAAAAGGISLLILVDLPVRTFVQEHRSGDLDGVSATVRHFGEWPFFAGVPAALLLAGLATGHHRVTGAGVRTAATSGASIVLVLGLKQLLGRERPSHHAGSPADFDGVGGEGSFPSGHATMAFALAASLADEIRNPWATAGLYTAAGAVAWSRVNDNYHWLSDVVAGALLGTATARVVNGRWRIFGWTPPTVSLGHSGASLAWQLRL